MSCNCERGCPRCQGQVIREIFNCPGSQQVIKHEHIIRHQHDIIHEYDVVHEHEFTTRDVVRERTVENHNDCRTHEPNYCGDDCNGHPQMPARPRFWQGRRW